MTNLKTLLLLLILLLVCPQLKAQAFSASNEPAQLVELFTSQGCSSCPRAERWLNSFKDDPDLWVRLFPLAWHVTYWDSLGWVDKFSSAVADHRQYRYHHQGITSGVYTPQAVVNGSEWRALLAQPIPSLPETSLANQPKLSLHVTGNTFTANGELDNGLLNVALVGMDFKVKVKRGENAGRYLEEQFVVLGFGQYAQQDKHWQGALPETKSNLPAQAIVAWLSKPGNNMPLSIAGGLLSPAVQEAHHP